jgi:hypothetical protein
MGVFGGNEVRELYYNNPPATPYLPNLIIKMSQ